jgi:hypothetical protein
VAAAIAFWHDYFPLKSHLHGLLSHSSTVGKTPPVDISNLDQSNCFSTTDQTRLAHPCHKTTTLKTTLYLLDTTAKCRLSFGNTILPLYHKDNSLNAVIYPVEYGSRALYRNPRGSP